MLDRDGRLLKVIVPWANWSKKVDGYYYYMSTELEYGIMLKCTVSSCKRKTSAIQPLYVGGSTDIYKNGNTFEHTSIFQPFHRYFPLRYEFELDKVVLENIFFKNQITR